MSNVRVKINLPGIREVKNSPGVMALLEQSVQSVAGGVPASMEPTVTTAHHPVTGVARIEAHARDAMKQEADNGYLARAIGAAGKGGDS